MEKGPNMNIWFSAAQYTDATKAITMLFEYVLQAHPKLGAAVLPEGNVSIARLKRQKS